MKSYSIIGGGLAGLSLAARLVLAGEKVTLIDDASPSGASRLAAGMFNIVTGKHAVKTWLSEELLAALTAFFEIPVFAELKQYLHYQPLYRPFKDIGEYNDWLGKGNSPALATYIRFQHTEIYPNFFANPLGGIFIDKCGWLDTGGFLEGLLSILKDYPHFQYIEKKVVSQQISLTEQVISLEGNPLPFDELILANGWQVSQADSLWQIPLLPVKGEILRIYAPDLQLPFLLSGKIYVIPTGNEHFIAGATYEWDFADTEPTQAGKAQLCSHLDELLKKKYTIISHQAGIRPATHDRRPVLGTHPQFPHLHVFTGFGTKGVLSFAYFSEKMVAYLQGKQGLEKEYDIQRYYRKGRIQLAGNS